MRTRYIKTSDIDFNSMTRKSVQELCQQKRDNKMMKEITLERCINLANKYAEEIREAILKFKKGELDYVSVLLLRDEVVVKFFKKVKDENLTEHISDFDVKHIWNNTLKKLQGLL